MMGVSYVEQYLSVSQLTRYIARKFDKDPYLDRIYLKGEISNYNARRRGSNEYFNIKDEGAIISAVLFAGVARSLKFDLEEGMSVLIEGRVQVYQRGGNYQIIVQNIHPDGVGNLYLAYEQTKEKLMKEGLFAPELKRAIPKYPKRIGVITSPSGAVIQDIMTTIKRRYPIAEIVLFPTVVQGEQSANSIVNSLRLASEKGNLDTLIIGRGGGSFEDLFSFNEEIVVRAISEMTIPIISSVGHETDNTLTDFVADLRAPTPTAAAELAVPLLTDEILKLDAYSQRLIRSFQGKLIDLSGNLNKITHSVIFRQPKRLYDGYLQNVDQLESRLLNEIDKELRQNRQTLELLNQRLESVPILSKIREKEQTTIYVTQKLQASMINLIKDKQNKVNQNIQALDHLSPLKILTRGYAVLEKDEAVIKSTNAVQVGDTVQVRMADGTLETVVKDITIKEEK